MKKSEEVEVKIAIPDAASARALLRGLGFRVHRGRVFERNLVLDDEAGTLRARGLLLRVRTAGKLVTCTFKNKDLSTGVHKRREEREFHPDHAAECLAVFAGLGYHPGFAYEKFRTEFGKPLTEGSAAGKSGLVMLDETPIGVFLELEGPSRWIDRTAKEMGYSRADYITASYGALFQQWRREFAVELNEMSFRNVPQRI